MKVRSSRIGNRHCSVIGVLEVSHDVVDIEGEISKLR